MGLITTTSSKYNRTSGIYQPLSILTYGVSWQAKSRGISYVPGSESAAFEFHPFIVEDLLKFVNNSTTLDAFEAREALPLPKCWSKMNKSYPCDVAEVPMKVADVSIYISLQTRIRGTGR